MLRELYIENLAIIDNLALKLEPGLNIITGETGAGKSVIIGALGLLSGFRASQEAIRSGCEKGIVSGAFEISDGFVENLREFGIPDLEEGMLILSREISRNGKNLCRINDKIFTLSGFRAVGSQLIDIYGQNEERGLLVPQNQLQILDRFGGRALLEAKEETAVLYRELVSLDKTILQEKQKQQDMMERRDFFQYQLDEINNANLLDPEEEEHLEAEIRVLSGAEVLAENSLEIYGQLFAQEEQSSAYDHLSRAIETLEEMVVYDNSLETKSAFLKDLLYSVRDASDFFRAYAESVEHNPDKLNMLQERLSMLRNLQKKYRRSISELLVFRDEISQILEEHSFAGHRIEELEKRKTDLAERYLQAAANLSALRKETGEYLSKQVTAILHELEMKDSRFEACFTTREGYSEEGREAVEYLFSANTGEPLKPLQKVASGGELSRLMLSLKTVLAKVDTVPVLVFDEADTGIGGEAARKVGLRIDSLASAHQVLCVTHSAQVAVFADHHIKILKQVLNTRTIATVQQLSEKERAMEIARMIGGKELDTAFKHAEKMLAGAQKEKR